MRGPHWPARLKIRFISKEAFSDLNCGFSLPLWKSHAWSAAACGDLNAPLTLRAAGRWSRATVHCTRSGNRWRANSIPAAAAALSGERDDDEFLFFICRHRCTTRDAFFCLCYVIITLWTSNCARLWWWWRWARFIWNKFAPARAARLESGGNCFLLRAHAAGETRLLIIYYLCNKLNRGLHWCVMRDVCVLMWFIRLQKWLLRMSHTAWHLYAYTILHFIWMSIAKA